jgi:hypothetical protein
LGEGTDGRPETVRPDDVLGLLGVVQALLPPFVG